MGAQEFILNIGDQKINAFVYSSFLSGKTLSSPLHSHRYTEIHFTVRGKYNLWVGGSEILSQAGDVTVIPGEVDHRSKKHDPNAAHYSFMINFPVSRVSQIKIDPAILSELEEKMRSHRGGDDLYPISSYLAFICKDIVKAKTELSRASQEFIICEFFANHYHKNVGLSDLAEQLNLSTKQTARLVKKYMGETFSKVIERHRIVAAKRFIQREPELNLGEIAQLVGYSSYSGFWKAFHRAEYD